MIGKSRRLRCKIKNTRDSSHPVATTIAFGALESKLSPSHKMIAIHRRQNNKHNSPSKSHSLQTLKRTTILTSILLLGLMNFKNKNAKKVIDNISKNCSFRDSNRRR
jgi:hypothetical protein